MNKFGINLSSALAIVLAVLFFWVFIFNIWFKNNILNRENFVNTTVSVLSTEETRNAIADEVVGVVQQKAPVIGQITAPILTKVIVGVLDTDLFNNVFNKLAEEIYYQMTTSNPRPLEIKTGGIAVLISPLLADQNPNFLKNFPDKIVIIKQGSIPSLYQFSNILSILGPVLLIAGLILAGFSWIKTVNKRSFFVVFGLTLAATGFIIYSMIPVVGNYITSSLSSPNAILILTNIYDAFTYKIVDFSLYVLVIGLVLAICAKFLRKSLFKLPKKR